MSFHVIVIVGEVCSGKTTYANRYPIGVEKLDVGDIVRDITQRTERVHNKDLDAEISNVLINRIMEANANEYHGIAIVGIRQLSIYNAIYNYCVRHAGQTLHTVLLEVPHEVGAKRYARRQAEKDLKLPFHAAIERDLHLGLGSLIAFLKERPHTFTIKNYTQDEVTSNTLQEKQDWKDSRMDH
jgi:adenylate kinase family enzyme